MMTRAYDESYVWELMETMGAMMEFAVVGCGMPMSEFYDRFLGSSVPREIERGNPTFLAGSSGMELAYIAVRETGGCLPDMKSYVLGAPGPEYWTGWALTYLQWYTGYRFKDLSRYGMDACGIMDMYYPLHEADVSKFVDDAMAIIERNRKESSSPLKSLRKSRGITQKELAAMSGVSLRMIQAYEQKDQNFGRAEVASAVALSKTLGCRVEDLL